MTTGHPTAARPGGRLSRPLARVFADPMLRNGHALIFSAGVTQVIGVLYWVVAARNYPAAVVGRNSAAIAITLFLAGLAELNMMSTLVRFLPTSGHRTVRFVLAVYAAATAVALLVGAAFYLLIPRLEPQLSFLRSSPFLGVWFVASIATGAIFVLQDSALTGVRAATFVPVENTVFAVVKLAMMVPLVSLLPTSGIYVSWTAAFALSVLPTNAYLFARAIPRQLRTRPATGPPPRFADIRSYLIPDSLAAFFFMAATSLLPLMIIQRLGPAAAGHYAPAWLIGYALYLVSLNMGSSLMVETAADQSGLRERSVRSITHLAKLVVPVVAVVVVAAPYALSVFGPGYAATGTGALRLLAASAVPALITNTAVSVARVRRRMAVVAGIQVCICVAVWSLAVALIGPLGLTGVGAAWLIAQSAVAAVLLVRPSLWLPARPGPAEPGEERDLPGRKVMTDTGDGQLGILAAPSGPGHRDLRWSGQPVRVTAPVPAEVWAEVAAADPSTLPFQTPTWRDCLCAGSGWRDASRLYELRDGRRLVLMMARRAVAPGLVVEASWPAGWGSGGVLAPGGVRPGEAAMIGADLRRGRAVSSCVRPGFAAAPAWPAAASGAFLIPRAVHVAQLGGESFEDYWAHRVPAKTQRAIRAALRHHQKDGVVISSGNSPELVDALYRVYLSWIDWRAARRRMPAALARRQARRAEPLAKFTSVARALGPDCRIWVAWWEGRPVAATVSLYAGEAAIGWRAFTDRSAPGRLRLFEVLAMEGLRDACESGRRYLEMGESVGRKDLSAIKERLGGQEHTFAEYCFERVPLAAGRMAFQRYRRGAEQWITSRTGRAGARKAAVDRPPAGEAGK